MDWTKIIEAVITLIFAIITYLVVPAIKNVLAQKFDNEQLGNIKVWVKVAVQAAEQIYTESGMGQAKKAYVETFLSDLGIKADSEEINNLIESAVLEIKNEVIG